jgi:hypothetical protein
MTFVVVTWCNMVVTDDFGGCNMVVPDDFGGGNMVIPDHFGGVNMVVPVTTLEVVTWS